MQSSSSSVPAVLTRYPAEIQAAFLRFRADRNAADLGVLVQAALHEYMPRRGPEAPPALTGESRLIEDLGIDSLGVAEMIFFFEDLFDVSIPSNEVLGLKTVSQLERYVQDKLAARHAATAVAS